MDIDELFYKYADNGTVDDKFLMSKKAFTDAIAEIISLPVEAPVIRNRAKAVNKRINCVGCKHLSKLSEAGYRYCLHKDKKNSNGKVENVNIKQPFCPIAL